MEDKHLEIADYYESRVRRGFPSGEVRAALLQKGYTDTEADTILAKMGTIAKEKSTERNQHFRFIIGGVFVLLGILLLNLPQRNVGVGFIISGIIKIGFDVFMSHKEKA